MILSIITLYDYIKWVAFQNEDTIVVFQFISPGIELPKRKAIFDGCYGK